MADSAERLKKLRKEAYGDRGRSDFARALGIPITSYLNYENGRVPPIDMVVKMMALTRVNPQWLLHGKGQQHLPRDITLPPTEDAACLVTELLEENARLRKQQVAAKRAARPAATVVPAGMDRERWLVQERRIQAAAEEHLAVPILSGRVASNSPENVLDADNDGWALFPKSAVKHPRSTFAFRVQDDAMEPAVPEGALVGIDRSMRDLQKVWRSRKRLVAIRDAKSGCVISQFEKAGEYWVVLSASGAGPMVWAEGEAGRSPVIGTVVFVFSAC